MMRWKEARTTLTLFLVAVALAVWAGTPVPNARSAAAIKDVPVGIVVPLTGSFASLGQEHLWADQTAVDIVNTAHPDISIYYAKT